MITRVNNNRGRRFLDPLEVEAQYHTEDRTVNPDLLLWIDFTDGSSLASVESGGSAAPVNGHRIMLATNKSYWAGDSSYPNIVCSESAGAKSLGKYCLQTNASKCPTFVDPQDGTPPYALFGFGDFLQCSKNMATDTLVNSSDLSTSGINCDSFTIYYACERNPPPIPARQDVVFVTTNDFQSSLNIPYEWFAAYFNASNYGRFEFHDNYSASGTQHRYSSYDSADDSNFHYHMFNSYDQWSNNSPNGLYTSLQADGAFHQFSEYGDDPSLFPSPFYSKLQQGLVSSTGTWGAGTSGGLDKVFEFDNAGTYHPSITIGGQPRINTGASGSAAKGTFVGKIYEILIFKGEHAGGNALDDLYFSSPFKRRWSNMLYYFQRKYQKITPKN